MNLTTNGIIHVHTSVYVDLASAYRHLPQSVFEDAFKFLSKPLDHPIVDFAPFVAQLKIIHVITYSHLLPVYHLVRDAHIVRVNLKPNVCQTLCKLMVIYKACNHRAIQRVLLL